MTDPQRRTRLPLFPLGTVLFPGGTLPLKIFETRYLDMVTERLRANGEIGMVLIRQGREVGEAAAAHALGTLAKIADWDRTPQGLLHITVQGTTKFRTLTTEVQSNQLQMAEIERLDAEPQVPVPDNYSALADIAIDLLSKLRPGYADSYGMCADDAAWVGGRLAELLPFEARVKQEMLELHDPLARLALLDTNLRKLHVS